MPYFTYHLFVNTSGAYQILVTFDQLMTPVQGEGVLKFLAVSLHYVVYFDFLTQSLSEYPDDIQFLERNKFLIIIMNLSAQKLYHRGDATMFHIVP